jgi:hypothetical protein
MNAPSKKVREHPASSAGPLVSQALAKLRKAVARGLCAGPVTPGSATQGGRGPHLGWRGWTGSKDFFSEEKKQKIFANAGLCASCEDSRQQQTKVFWFFSSEKNAFPFSAAKFLA